MLGMGSVSPIPGDAVPYPSDNGSEEGQDISLANVGVTYNKQVTAEDDNQASNDMAENILLADV